MNASWMTDSTLGGRNTPAFDQWMLQLAQSGHGQAQTAADAAQQFAQLHPDSDQNINGVQSLDQMYQELGEGNQGRRLFDLFSGGLTPEQISTAQATPPPPTTYHQGSYGDQVPDTNVAGSFGSYVQQPLFEHSLQNDANTGAFGFDPQRGLVTSPANVNKQNTGLAGYLGEGGIAQLIAMAMAAGGGAAIGAVGGAGTGALSPANLTKLPQMAQGFGNGGGASPSSLLGLTGLIPGMEGIAPWLRGAGGIYSAVQSKNPIGGAATLAQLFGRGG